MMMKIDVFSLGPLQTNCYLISSEAGREAIIIDPGMNPGKLLDKVKERE